MSLGFKRLKQP